MEKKHSIRVRNGFSDRNEIKPIPKIIQFDTFSSETRIVLFNAVIRILHHQIVTLNLNVDELCKNIVEDLFNEVFDSFDHKFYNLTADILKLFKYEPYDSVLTMIEFLCQLVYESPEQCRIRNHYDVFFMDSYLNTYDVMNDCFENEFLGYRFVGDQIIKITNKDEIATIVESTKTPYDNVNESISKSISLLSETSKKDFENSIKESVLAVEQLLNIILKTEGVTLGKAMEQILAKAEIDEHLRDTIKSIYKYASNSNGIRHGNNKEKKTVSFEEAKFILVLCSATINYLVNIKIN
jgi:hypothetical protein